ncbi:putative nicotinate-nucleotide pyrophosphorylase [carboxylating] [Vibrio aerogenes CECT 7868]|uniref:Putative pyrophosphorylase ModD n=2 Tax=Vibrio aerogenes TaxID=92172 RepID=A0A1M5ZLL7_9VIBR|nr:putative nicotinate-nucleotide pyrophosphorylase [carboxylating] [Vibrio aerogenes CECT 7868]
MNFYISDTEVEKILEEDISTIDLTSLALSLKDEPASITFQARHLTMISAVEEVVTILKKLNLTVTSFKPSGTLIQPGESFIQAQGMSSAIQIAWRTCSKTLEYFSGVATRTHHMVTMARKINPKVTIATTRKNIPGTKKMAIKSIICGGAIPHRLGLSETVLVFGEHMTMMGGLDTFIERLPEIKTRMIEKKIGAEAHSFEAGIQLVHAGIDFVQLDKFDIQSTATFIEKAKHINKNIIVIATGNINIENIEDYTKTGADVINTSFPYHGKPADIKAEIKLLK